jgi:hypothetical protein
MILLSEQDHMNFPTARGQFGGRDKAIPTIIPWSGHDDDRTVFDEIHGGFSNGLAGTQHQCEARSSRGDREFVGAAHFRCCQHFHAEFPILPLLTEAVIQFTEGEIAYLLLIMTKTCAHDCFSDGGNFTFTTLKG